MRGRHFLFCSFSQPPEPERPGLPPTCTRGFRESGRPSKKVSSPQCWASTRINSACCRDRPGGAFPKCPEPPVSFLCVFSAMPCPSRSGLAWGSLSQSFSWGQCLEGEIHPIIPFIFSVSLESFSKEPSLI